MTASHVRRISGLLAAALLAALVIAWTQPAQAGGPTSVLVVAPDMNKATALYVGTPRYGQLESLVRSGEDTPQKIPGRGGTYIIATWLLHDTHVWRVDRIFLSAAGGPWIATEEVASDRGPSVVGPAIPSAAVWHKPDDPAALKGLLDTLGLVGASASAPAPPQVTVDSSGSAPDTAAPAAATVQAAEEPGVGTGWWWAAPGLLIGLLTGLLISRTTLRLKRPQPQPAEERELLDRAHF